MTKAVILPLGLMLLLAAAPASRAQAQATAEETAVNEAIYRQANRVILIQKLTEARSAQSRNAPASAAKLYDEAWDLAQKIGSGVDAEREQTIAGLAAVRLDLARAAQGQNQLEEADIQIKDVLRVDPANAAALDFKRGNEQLMPSSAAPFPAPKSRPRCRPLRRKIFARARWSRTASCSTSWAKWKRPRPSFTLP